jgi:uncharacterized membrane protein
MSLAAATAYSFISLYRHNRFGSTVDLATQAQTVWGYSRLEIIPNTVIGIPNLLGDHFHPILMALAPLFWIWDSAAVLLLAQAALLALAGLPIYMWAAERLGVLAGLAFQASFYVYWGIFAGVLFDFHHVVFAVAAVSWALYATVTRRNLLLAFSVAVAMLTREDIALTLIALGFYIAIAQRRFVVGAVLMGLNLFWFGLLIGVIMPALAGSPYRHWTFNTLGTGPLSAAWHVIRDPFGSLELLFRPIAKARVWVASFGNWLFLPLISPLALIAVPDYLERFWNDLPYVWTFHMQYSMPAAPILAFAAIDGAARLKTWRPAQEHSSIGVLAAVAVLLTSTLLSVIINPLAELSTYVSSATAANIQSCLDVIPPTASVASTQNLLAHLAARAQIYQIPIQKVNGSSIDPISAGVQYIAVDMATEGKDSQYRSVVQRALDNGYGVACTKGLTVILGKGVSAKTLTPELNSWLAGECNGRACLSKPSGG